MYEIGLNKNFNKNNTLLSHPTNTLPPIINTPLSRPSPREILVYLPPSVPGI